MSSWPPTMPGAWRASSIVGLLGAALTALVAGAVLAIGWFDYRGAIDAARANQELMARVLEDQATRTVDSAALALATLAERLEERPGRPPAEVLAMLREALPALPFMRSLALVDKGGTVLAATSAADAPGRVIDLARLGPPRAAAREWLGPLVPGRGLADLAAAGSSAAPPGLGFIPLVRPVRLGADGSARLVGLLNPDAFANQQTLALADSDASAVLTDYAAAVLAASAVVPPGQGLGAHPVFRSELPRREHGSLVTPAEGGESRVVAFRASRTRPLVVLVERAEAAVRARWWHDVRGIAAVCAAAVLFLAGMAATAWRGMRARERTREQLDLAQQEVARRERELTVIVKSVQELLFRTDERGAITFVNERWRAVAGSSEQSAVGMRLAELAQPDQRARVEALFEAGAGPGARTAQIALAPRGGTPRLFDLAVVPLSADRRIVGFAGSAVDVTERVTAQQKLQTQLAVTELMLETSPLPLSLRALDGRYLSVNQAWEDFTGRRRADVLGRSPTAHVTPDEHELHAARDRELLTHGERLRYEASVRHRDGSRRDVVLLKVLVPGDGGAPAGILTMLMDVSEFRAAERATREARDAAEEASRAKSEFIANISHELRTPLQSILGFSELGAVRGSAQPKLAAMFEDIHASGQRMLALVNDLLDVAKIESAVGTFHLERTDLRPLVTAVAHELGPLLAKRDIQLAVALADLPLVAKVDPLRFQQVLRNVLANAIRFSPEHSRIDLSAQPTSQGEIHLRVRDRGPGIPPAELERIFEAFAQSSLTKDGSGGTGLGLTICRTIIEIHGGRIAAENCPDGGAAFNIHVPLKGSAETAPMPL